MGRFAGKDILDRSKDFAVRVIRMSRALPRGFSAQHITHQIVRSATSIGANLNEADMTESLKDFCHKVNLAQKEAAETRYWLDLLIETEIFPQDRLKPLAKEASELTKICRQIVLSTRRKTNP